MKNISIKIILLCILYFIILSCIKTVSVPIDSLIKNHTSIKRVQVTNQDGSIDYLDLDDYLLGVVSGEMPLTFEDEALKAQIVASRSFVVSRNYQVDTSTKTQVYLDHSKRQENWQENTEQNEERLKKLIQATHNEILTYQGKTISALFFSSSNGYTQNSEDYFQASANPYLRSVESPFEQESCPNLVRQKTFTIKQLSDLFEFSVDNIQIIDYNTTHHVKNVKVNDQMYSGRQVRELLTLASTDFSITQEGNNYIFTTVGSGHGVGMSQYGANGMALLGYNYKEILEYYYQGVEISKI